MRAPSRALRWPDAGSRRAGRLRRAPEVCGVRVPIATLGAGNANEQFAHGSAQVPLGSAAMEQRMAAQRQRGAGLNRRGNAAGGTGGATGGAGGSGAPAGRFYAGGPHGTGPRTGPIGPVARSESTEPDQPAGRHRSPWGRPGRILPIRWGRIVVGALATAGVITAIIGFALVSRGGSSGRGTAAGDSGASGQQSDSTNPVAVVAPSPAAGASDRANSGVASPAPGRQEIFPTQLTTAPPPPTGPSTGAVLVTGQPGPRPTGPALTLGRTSVDLGSVDSTDTVTLTDSGTAGLDLRIGAGLPPWLTAVPQATHLDAGYQTQLVITLDRSTAPVGQIDVRVQVTPAQGSGGGTIHVTGVVTAGPVILSVTPPPALSASACATSEAPATGPLTVQVRDPVGMAGGTVAVTSPDGTATTLTLQLATTTDDQSTWTASLGPSSAGTLAFTVTVKDLNNRVATRQGSLSIAPC